MKFLNSLLETLKKFWYLFVILALTALVLVVGFVENSKLAGLVRSLKDVVTNYKEQVKTIDKLAGEKADKDKKVVKTKEEMDKKIQEQREAALAKVNAKKLKLVDELKDESGDLLAQKMKDEFKL